MVYGEPSVVHRRSSQFTMDDRSRSEQSFVEAARQRWQQLGEELRADVAEFNSREEAASFTQASESRYRVSNSVSGLEVVLTADFAAHTVRYDYMLIAGKSAGTPEGGILSMRERQPGSVEFYSSDEQLTPEETRQVVLEPVLFPPQLAA
jgi:hypothetical protein